MREIESNQNDLLRDFSVVQQLRICLAMQGMWIWSLVGKLRFHMPRSYWTWKPHLESPSAATKTQCHQINKWIFFLISCWDFRMDFHIVGYGWANFNMQISRIRQIVFSGLRVPGWCQPSDMRRYCSPIKGVLRMEEEVRFGSNSYLLTSDHLNGLRLLPER